MVVSPGLLRNASGLMRLAHPPHRNQRRNGFGPSRVKYPRESVKLLHLCLNSAPLSKEQIRVSNKLCVSARQTPSFADELPEHPLWLRDFVWSTGYLFSFMAEQPSQLKFIEWPSFATTIKTATLSLFLVAVFIVALSSVDSALCYMLALILRKAP